MTKTLTLETLSALITLLMGACLSTTTGCGSLDILQSGIIADPDEQTWCIEDPRTGNMFCTQDAGEAYDWALLFGYGDERGEYVTFKDPVSGKSMTLAASISRGWCINSSTEPVDYYPEKEHERKTLQPGESHDCDGFLAGCPEGQVYKIPNACTGTWDGQKVTHHGWGCGFGAGCVDDW
jgi:hypothetical protein